MENFAQGLLAISISGGADSGNKLPFPNPRNPFLQAGASSSDWGEIPHALPFHNPFDQAGVLSTDWGDIPPALPFPNPFAQGGASFTNLGDVPHALPFPNPFDQAGAASSTDSLSVKSWEIAIDGGMDELEESCPFIPLSKILKATNDFDEKLVIGTGGFGKVYKAIIDDGATTSVAAIKRSNPESNQGVEEFWTEVKLLSKLRHPMLGMQTTFSNRIQQQRSATSAESSAAGRRAVRLAASSARQAGSRPGWAVGRGPSWLDGSSCHLGFAYKYKLLYSLFPEQSLRAQRERKFLERVSSERESARENFSQRGRRRLVIFRFLSFIVDWCGSRGRRQVAEPRISVCSVFSIPLSLPFLWFVFL